MRCFCSLSSMFQTRCSIIYRSKRANQEKCKFSLRPWGLRSVRRESEGRGRQGLFSRAVFTVLVASFFFTFCAFTKSWAYWNGWGGGDFSRLRTDSQKFKTLVPTLMSHATSANHLLTALSDEAGLKLALSSIMRLAPYYLSFKKVVRALVKSVAAVWSEAANSEATRITAFLVLRRVVVIGDAGLRQATLRAAYQGLVRGSRNTTVHTIQGVNLMKNSAAELWGLDPSVGYTTGFTFIRQLAIHLRSCITNPTKVK